MATDIEKPLPIMKLHVGEFRVQMIGGMPQGWARVAFMADDGTTLGDTTYSAFSPETWGQINQVCKLIEEDFSHGYFW